MVREPTLYADDFGVWEATTTSSSRSGIRWSEIFRVSGHKLDGITETYTIIELDFEYGEYVELNDAWPGFDQVVKLMSQKLPRLRPSWFAEIQALKPGDEALVVWQRE